MKEVGSPSLRNKYPVGLHIPGILTSPRTNYSLLNSLVGRFIPSAQTTQFIKTIISPLKIFNFLIA